MPKRAPAQEKETAPAHHNGPAATIRQGNLKCVIWRNQSEKGQREKRGLSPPSPLAGHRQSSLRATETSRSRRTLSLVVAIISGIIIRHQRHGCWSSSVSRRLGDQDETDQ